MNCERCLDPITDGESYSHRGKILCEDCYIGALQPPKSCDVTAVHSAKTHRQLSGESGTDGLTELQCNIYDRIKEIGKLTRPELMAFFNLKEWELDKEMAILRHCELIKARKIGEQIYAVPFELE
ncbi:MAG TPA: hypothetical protein GX523_07475 [Desulfitobacterium dehalogenans]|uniref:Uncharacterized protein n=1 Tax=Desulfitobacterium dehalogenans TaxID=36854 RepID=A0A7C7D593_9FIRM|nr:hypothetical protein [Desulfitobacterium dehalogenans]